MTRFFRYSLLCLAGGLLMGCARTVMVKDLEPLADAWEAAYEDGDEEALAALYTSDAIAMPPEVEPLAGPEEIRAYFTEVLPGADVTITTKEVTGKGKQAQAMGSYLVQDGGRTVGRGDWAGSYIREGKIWMLRRHLWNSTLTLEMQASLLRRELQAVVDAYEAAYNRSDVDGLMALYAPGATLLPPHYEPVTERDDFRRHLAPRPGAVADMSLLGAATLGAEVLAFGTLAYKTENGEELDRTNWAGVFEEANRRWQIRRLMWSSEYPVSAESSPVLRDAIARANARYLAARRTQDPSEITALYTADAILMPPNRSVVRGPGSILGYWRSIYDDDDPPGADLQMDDVVGVGDMAYETGSYTLTGPRDRVLERGKYLLVWKYEDGAWKLHREVWNSSTPILPLPPPAAPAQEAPAEEDDTEDDTEDDGAQQEDDN